MGTELELKLMIQPAYIESASNVLNEICEQSESCSIEPDLQLMNGYFDTPDGLLMQSGVTLRVRAINQGYIQTLKTRGSNRAGISSRGEWEWDVKNGMLDLSLLENTMLPSNLHDKWWSNDLLEVFRTDFTRKVFMITYNDTLMEVVIDQGAVSSPYGSEPIHELEIELKSGEEEGLYAFANKLAIQLPVQISTVSKAAKGARLKHNKIIFPKSPTSIASDFELSIYWYEMWLAYWEAMCFLDDTVLLVPICDAIERLADYLPSDLSEPLTPLIRELNLIHHHSKQDSPLCLTELLSVGQAMIKIGHWLNCQQ